MALTRLALVLATGCLAEPPLSLCTGDFGAPVPLPSAIDTNQNEDGAFLLHAELGEVFFNRNDGGLYHARRDTDGQWLPAIHAVRAGLPHSNPHVSQDGKTLWVDGDVSAAGIFRATRPNQTDAMFSDPVLIPGTEGADAPSFTDDELDFYYAYKVDGVYQIYTLHRASPDDPIDVTKGLPVKGLGFSGVQVGSPAISGDGGVLLVQTLDPPLQIYRSTGRGAAFTDVKPFGPVDAYDGSTVDDVTYIVATPNPDAPGSQIDLFTIDRACD